MKTWQVAALGEPLAVMEFVEVPDPKPSPDELVVRVLGAAANFPDVLMCRGAYQVRPELPFTPGIELCGDVVDVGANVTEFVIGERVLGASVLPAGGFGELAVMSRATTFAAPPQLDAAEASALYVGYQTGWFGLYRRAALQAGETLLVHAAAGGVGSAAIQLGKAAGARVIGVVSSTAKAQVARSLGADVVVNRSEQDFVEVVNEVTAGRGADVIYDPVGGETFARSTKCTAFEGRILLVGFAGGEIQSARLNHALIKNYSIVGLHWGLYQKHDLAAVRSCHDELARLVADDFIRPIISERLSLRDVPSGLQRLADGQTIGRVAYVS